MTCYAGDVVLLQRQPLAIEEGQIRKLAELYGLGVHTFNVSSPDSVERLIGRLKNPATRAVLASQDALSGLDSKRILAALRRPGTAGIPMLVFQVEAREHANDLKFWSNGSVVGCAPQANDFRPKALEVRAAVFSRELAGFALPAVAAPACDMRMDSVRGVQTVLTAREDHRTSAVLVYVRAGNTDLFFAPRMEGFDFSWVGQPASLPKAFSSMAPFILFLGYAAGDHGWHLDGRYANLTIDDPWLTQPYGHLDYPALLAQMDKHNFHTTIAFIPWNFDRSEQEVASLFRARMDRFSICIHGNDHTHQEFGDYGKNSLREQVADVKQSVARMERFRALTGISYDRFMVFPHSVAPEATFDALKTYDFLGTANSLNVPLSAPFPADPAFLLRPYTIDYANFLSFSRYSAERQLPRLEIAIQSFLGNPLLFYGHQDLFDKDIGAFNEFADSVNRLQPGTQWTGLGEIARHLHLVRRRADDGFDVQMFSNEMDLKNPTDKDAVFYVERKEGVSPTIHSLTIDGISAAFGRSGNVLSLQLIVPAGKVRKLRVAYRNDLDYSREDIGKNSLYAYALRRASDFRDLHLSKSSWGRTIRRAYYHYRWDSIELILERNWQAGLACVGLMLAGFWYLRHVTRKRAL